MPRARDIIVPDAVMGIEEVVIKHTKTKMGTVRTTEKVVPVLRPQKESSGQSSRSKKKGKLPQHVNKDGGSGGGIPIIDNLQTDLYMCEDDNLPEVAEQGNQLQAT